MPRCARLAKLLNIIGPELAAGCMNPRVSRANSPIMRTLAGCPRPARQSAQTADSSAAGQDGRMGNVYDDERLASVYHSGNQMPQRSLRAWATLIGSFNPRPSPVVLDMGTGTGMLATAMARWMPARAVIGMDPSVPMLARASLFTAQSHVHYAAGAAEAIPARHQVFDLALLSRVIHHLPDRRACAGEFARVLRHNGTAVIRTTFRDDLDALVYRYWPRLLEIDRDRFPGKDEVIADFTACGFTVTQLTSFAQPVTPSLRDYHARMTARPQSKFTFLTAAEFRDGLQQLEHDALAEQPSRPAPVGERYDVLVLTAA
jgi:ubiquinone/menaquinone biosynthesis C-methylase UbiE